MSQPRKRRDPRCQPLRQALSVAQHALATLCRYSRSVELVRRHLSSILRRSRCPGDIPSPVSAVRSWHHQRPDILATQEAQLSCRNCRGWRGHCETCTLINTPDRNGGTAGCESRTRVQIWSSTVVKPRGRPGRSAFRRAGTLRAERRASIHVELAGGCRPLPRDGAAEAFGQIVAPTSSRGARSQRRAVASSAARVEAAQNNVRLLAAELIT